MLGFLACGGGGVEGWIVRDKDMKAYDIAQYGETCLEDYVDPNHVGKAVATHISSMESCYPEIKEFNLAQLTADHVKIMLKHFGKDVESFCHHLPSFIFHIKGKEKQKHHKEAENNRSFR